MTTISIVLTVTGPAATGIAFTPTPPWSGSGAAATAQGPIAAGTPVGVFTVSPSNWTGAVALSGANAASFTLTATSATTYALATAAVLPVGTVANVTATPTP